MRQTPWVTPTVGAPSPSSGARTSHSTRSPAAKVGTPATCSGVVPGARPPQKATVSALGSADAATSPGATRSPPARHQRSTSSVTSVHGSPSRTTTSTPLTTPTAALSAARRR